MQLPLKGPAQPFEYRHLLKHHVSCGIFAILSIDLLIFSSQREQRLDCFRVGGGKKKMNRRPRNPGGTEKRSSLRRSFRKKCTNRAFNPERLLHVRSQGAVQNHYVIVLKPRRLLNAAVRSAATRQSTECLLSENSLK